MQTALQGWRKVRGSRDPDTLISMSKLGGLYEDYGFYSKAELLLKDALQTSREVLGPRHPETLTRLDNLALVFKREGRLSDAEPLMIEAMQGWKEVLGPEHPDTLINLSNLAGLYKEQGRLNEAETLLREAVQTSLRPDVLGPHNPKSLAMQLGLVSVLAQNGKPNDAVRTLLQMEPNLIAWVGQELYSTEANSVRRRLVSSQADFQNTVLTLATTNPTSESNRLAGNVMLHFKGMQGEEEAYLAHLSRRSEDPRVQGLANQVSLLISTEN
jgi:tetratricopeptide (TPR) repeat protein